MPKYVSYNPAIDPCQIAGQFGWYDTDEFIYPNLPTNLLEVTEQQWVARLVGPSEWAVSNGNLVPYTAPAPTLAQLQSSQGAMIKGNCQAEIISGFISSALGSPYNYPSDDNTQRNIAMAAANAGGTLWCETGSSWAMVSHTVAQAQQVQKDLFTMIQASQAKYSALLAEISAATTVAAVQEISW